jgi:hypothetical protein
LLFVCLFVCLFDPSVGVTASCFGLGATLSNFFGQMVVEKFDHVTSLMVSFAISLVPILVFLFMPETLGMRTRKQTKQQQTELQASHRAGGEKDYRPMAVRTGSSYGSCEE